MKIFNALAVLGLVSSLGALAFIAGCSSNSNPAQPSQPVTVVQVVTATFTVDPTLTTTWTLTSTTTPVTLLVTPTLTITPTPTNSPTASPTYTLTLTPTVTDTPTPSSTATDSPTITPSDTATDSPTVTPTSTPSDTATVTPTATSSFTPTVTPTITPTPNATPCSTTTIFGDNNVNPINDVAGVGNELNYNILNLPGPGSHTLWDVQLYSVSGGAQTVQAAVYHADTLALVAVSSQDIYNPGLAGSWHQFNFPQPETLVPGNYIVAAWLINGSGGGPYFCWDSTAPAGNYFYVATSYYSGFPATFPNPVAGSQLGEWDLYADICP